ncbi:MAG: VacJ family lipoprotein [Proteobacteria bacterium]|nr:VacJ family lipoprotein [Pseudomonadota bacterium]
MKKFGFTLAIIIILISGSLAFATELKPSIVPEKGEEYAEETEKISDPIEGFNRAMFVFNDKVYFYVLKPTARGYKAVVPEQARVSVRKFFTNVSMPIRFTNCLIQGKMKGAGTELSRFAINTTVGILGLFDPAKSYFSLSKHDEDFDQSLGYYCIDPGFYIVWPLLGPSSARGTVGLVGDALVDPASYLLELWPDYIGVSVFQVVNETSLTLGEYEDLKKAAIDPYVAVRNAYFQYRKNKVNE